MRRAGLDGCRELAAQGCLAEEGGKLEPHAMPGIHILWSRVSVQAQDTKIEVCLQTAVVLATLTL